MNPSEEKFKKRQAAGQTAMQISYSISVCFAAYLNVFLQSIGWSSSATGLLNAMNSTVSVFSIPFWGTISDRWHSIRKVLILLASISAMGYILIPLCDFPIWSISFLFLLIPALQFFRAPVYHLQDNWAVRSCEKHALNFGPIRASGSFAYAVVGISLGFLVTRLNGMGNNLGNRLVFPAYTTAMLCFLTAILLTADDVGARSQGKTKFRDLPFKALLSNHAYRRLLIYILLLKIPTASVSVFIPYLLAENGISTAAFGYVTGYKAFLEVPIMLSFQRLRRKVPLPRLILMTGIFYIGVFCCLSDCRSLLPILAISTLQGIADGVLLTAAPYYLLELAPTSLRASAQAIYAAVASAAGIIGNLLGGVLIDALGIRSYFLGAGGYLLLPVVFFLLAIRKEKQNPSSFL